MSAMANEGIKANLKIKFVDLVGIESSSSQIASAIKEHLSGPTEILVFQQPSIVMPDFWKETCVEGFTQLSTAWPNWAIAAARGWSLLSFDSQTQNEVNYLSSPSGLPNLAGIVSPITSFTADYFSVNLVALRKAGISNLSAVKDDEFGLLFPIFLAEEGLICVASPLMAAWCTEAQKSFGAPFIPRSGMFATYVAENYNAKIWPSTAGRLEIGFGRPSKARPMLPSLTDLFLRTSASARATPTLAIVIRTQFRDLTLLRRAISTARAFALLSGTTACTIHVVSDVDKQHELEYEQGVQHIFVTGLTKGDSRFKLVRAAVESIPAQHFWFVDDDDFVFPNHAAHLAQLLAIVPAESAIFVETKHFHETGWETGTGTKGQKYEMREGHHFKSNAHETAFSGLNQTPFCGVIFPRNAILTVASKAFERVTYAEDYLLLLHTLSTVKSLISTNWLLAGISIRGNSNTVTQKDRTKWVAANANVAYEIANGEQGRLNIFRSPVTVTTSESRSGKWAVAFLRALTSPKSWLIAKEFNVIGRVLSGSMGLKEFFTKLRIYLLDYRS